MPKQLVQDGIWKERIKTAVLYKNEYEKRFKCDILDKYYEGEQWKSQGEMAYNPYVINKVYETIQIKIAQFIPTFPKFIVSSRVQAEDDLQQATESSQLKEDVLNTIVTNPVGHFAEELEQAYKDSFFRFGIVEVGYEADWILNPDAPKPLLGKDTDQQISEEQRQKMVETPREIPVEERVFIKHIPAKTFFIGGQDHKYLSRCGWVGYYEYVDKDDLLALPKIINKAKIAGARGSTEEPNRESTPIHSEKARVNSVKIWHIWDLRSMQRLIILEDPCTTVFIKNFKRLPLFDLRPDRRLITNGFYPIPPAFHWLSPQDEYNETREMLRAHRRRFVRKFQIIEGTIDDEEIEKFETGPDGALIKVKRENAITPIENADLGQSVSESIATSADDLNRISGTTDESRGIADRTTATQANIVNQRTALRETKERDRLVKWFCNIGREILHIIKYSFTTRVLVRLTTTEGEHFGGSVNTTGPIFKWISAQELKDSYDFHIDVDLSSMSVTAQQSEKQKLLEFLSILTQYPMVAFSPYLVVEIAARVGYRNKKAIAEFQQMALMMELARMNQLKQAIGAQMPQSGNTGQQIVAQQTPPDGEQMRNQLQNQLGQTMQ